MTDLEAARADELWARINLYAPIIEREKRVAILEEYRAVERMMEDQDE